MARFTKRQGQYLAYIHLYWTLHRHGPSESEMAKYFQVSPPSAHQMVVKLEEEGLVTRKRGVSRSVRVVVPADELPTLPDGGRASQNSSSLPSDNRQSLYTLKVYLIGGPIGEEFAGQEISRTIQIRGDQTLADLHEAIFDAYDRFDEHMYEFQFGKGPHDPDGLRYGLEMAEDDEHAGAVETTTLDSLKLSKGQPFGYWFDFGDDWWHQVNVEKIGEAKPREHFPTVIERVGNSPPQYPDEDE